MSSLTTNPLPQSTPDLARHHDELAAALQRQMFAGVDRAELLRLIEESTEEEHDGGEVLASESSRLQEFHVLLEGTLEVARRGGGEHEMFRKTVQAPSFMGEMTILAQGVNLMTVTTVGPVRGLRVSEEGFWRLMATCPTLRAAILREFNARLRGLAAMQSQQERLMTLGTMTAGLMHELNNPGAAARRAASQLRENLDRMHLLARGFSEHGHSPAQRACLTELQERVLHGAPNVCMDSLQQADREEALSTWLDEHGLQHAWTLGPTLVSSGVQPEHLECLSAVFPGGALQDPVEWLAATASSMQQVALVEESVSRVHDLAKAVKTYVHEGQGGQHSVQINESLHATLVLLKHKIREKQIVLEKHFGPNLPVLTCVCSGLNQVWTNLLDNAIDAVPEGGHIAVRTWQDESNLLVSIADNGPGIASADQEHVFEAFYTTKPAGVGTGMGLGIARRIVEGYQGDIALQSEPGHTEFTIRIPLRS